MTETRTPINDLIDSIERIEDDEARLDRIETVRAALHDVSPLKHHPVDRVRWVPLHKVYANEYNPNAVAREEMRLLYVSISHDGYTQPVVAVEAWHDAERDEYTIVDGFHRFLTLGQNADLMESTMNRLPVVVIDKPIEERMASTVRHNRARGKHSIDGMANTVFKMLDEGMTEAEVASELGLSADEILRYKYVTGFAKRFEGVEYRREWKTKRQLRLEKEWKRANESGDPVERDRAAAKLAELGQQAGIDEADRAIARGDE